MTKSRKGAHDVRMSHAAVASARAYSRNIDALSIECRRARLARLFVTLASVTLLPVPRRAAPLAKGRGRVFAKSACAMFALAERVWPAGHTVERGVGPPPFRIGCA